MHGPNDDTQGMSLQVLANTSMKTETGNCPNERGLPYLPGADLLHVHDANVNTATSPNTCTIARMTEYGGPSPKELGDMVKECVLSSSSNPKTDWPFTCQKERVRLIFTLQI